MSRVESFVAPRAIQVRGVLFDMDGVLVNSTAGDELSWMHWARLHGMETTFSLHDTHGRRTIDTVRMLRPDLDAVAEVQRLEDYDEENQAGVGLLPGAGELIRALPAEAWTVVTSASERIMRSRLTAAGLKLPDMSITADSVRHGKPHPEPYLAGAKLLGLDPSECLVIEDAPPGIRSGKEAGCQVLAVQTSHPADALRQADWVVQSLSQISVELVEGWIQIILSGSE